jgi:hypothetical protein
MTEQQAPNPGVAKGNRDKKPTIQVKQGQLNFAGNLSIRAHPSLLWTFDDGILPILSFSLLFRN